MIRLNKIQKGILLAFVGVMIMTPDTLLIRMVYLDIWSLLFYRSLLPALALFLGYLVLFQRRTFNDFYNMGVPGIMNALCVLGANITFIFALANTNVANVLIMISLVPLTAALFSSVFLKEKPLVITWISMFACLLVVIFIFYEFSSHLRVLFGIPVSGMSISVSQKVSWLQKKKSGFHRYLGFAKGIPPNANPDTPKPRYP